MSPHPPTVLPTVLSFAASDPTAGAGLQADVLTIAALGCHPLSVVTALTVQDTLGVERVRPVDPDWVEAQARCLLRDIAVSAFKLGVLGSAQNIGVIAQILAEYPEVPVVVDPVLASGRGDPLSTDDSLQAMRDLLFPLTTVLTPNSLEARRLARLAGAASLAQCAQHLHGLGCRYVLITGTHEESAEVVNILYAASGVVKDAASGVVKDAASSVVKDAASSVVREDRWPRLPGSYHGSGCTLASAVAAQLARGAPMPEAVRAAQAYTWRALKQGFRPGRGQFVPNRMGVGP